MRVHFLKKRFSFAYTREKKNENAPTNTSLHKPPFPKKIGLLTPCSYLYAAFIRTIHAFDGFWLKRGKRIAMMVRAFQGVLCVNKPIYVACYKALCDVGQF